MPRTTHYSPALDRFLVSVLYHEAKRRKQPMTVVANTVLTDALKDTEGWRLAEEAHRDPSPVSYPDAHACACKKSARSQ